MLLKNPEAIIDAVPNFVILEAFYLLALLVHLLIVQHIFSSVFQDVGHSWKDYILFLVSPSMRYNTGCSLCIQLSRY